MTDIKKAAADAIEQAREPDDPVDIEPAFGHLVWHKQLPESGAIHLIGDAQEEGAKIIVVACHPKYVWEGQVAECPFKPGDELMAIHDVPTWRHQDQPLDHYVSPIAVFVGAVKRKGKWDH